MKLIVGLGNPEEKYKNTRHNTGKDFLNYILLKKKADSNWDLKKNLECEIALLDSNVVLAKPLLYMNEIGLPVKKLLGYFKLKTHDLIVCYDELDLILGRYKINFGMNRSIHNGVLSVKSYTKSLDFCHVRIGVREEKIPMSVKVYGIDPKEYVLEKLTKQELTIRQSAFDKLLVDSKFLQF